MAVLKQGGSVSFIFLTVIHRWALEFKGQAEGGRNL